MSDSDDDQPRLSPSTLATLEEFLKEKEEGENSLKYIPVDQISDIHFNEDWVSQFIMLYNFIYYHCTIRSS